MKSHKEKVIEKKELRDNRERNHNFIEKHPQLIPQKARDEFHRVPTKY